jgi:hypothetical protein
MPVSVAGMLTIVLIIISITSRVAALKRCRRPRFGPGLSPRLPTDVAVAPAIANDRDAGRFACDAFSERQAQAQTSADAADYARTEPARL